MTEIPNRTLTPFFKGMTLREAWEGDYGPLFDMPPEQMKLFKNICEKAPEHPAEAYLFLGKVDPLFKFIYEEGACDVSEGRQFVYPFAEGMAIPDHIRKVVGPIGAQTSDYHHENLMDHVAIVAANLASAGIDEQTAVLLAVLHDVGKKYTAATDKTGGLCFNEHATVSAFIAGYWLRSHLEPIYNKYLVAVIYGHLLPYTRWGVNGGRKTGREAEYRQAFFRKLIQFFLNDRSEDPTKLAKRVMTTIDILAGCDEGVSSVTPEVERKIKEGKSLLCRYYY